MTEDANKQEQESKTKSQILKEMSPDVVDIKMSPLPSAEDLVFDLDQISSVEPQVDAASNDADEISEDEKKLNESFALQQYLASLMTLKTAHADSETKPYFQSLYDETVEKGEPPQDMLDRLFSTKSAGRVKTEYEDIQQLHLRQFAELAANREWQDKVIEESGLSREVFDQLPQDFIHSLAAQDVFEKEFGVEKPSIGSRLAQFKDQVIGAVTSETGQQTLKTISWGVSIATGSVGVRLAMTGARAVIGHIAGLPQVQSFSERLLESAKAFLVEKGVPLEAIGEKVEQVKEKLKPITSSRTFKIAAGVAVGVGTMLLVNEFAADQVADLKALFQPDNLAQKAAQGVVASVEALSTAGEYASSVGSTVADVAGFGAETVTQLAQPALDALAPYASSVSDSLDSGIASINEMVPEDVKDALSFGAGRVADVSSSLATDALTALGDVGHLAAEGGRNALDNLTELATNAGVEMPDFAVADADGFESPEGDVAIEIDADAVAQDQAQSAAVADDAWLKNAVADGHITPDASLADVAHGSGDTWLHNAVANADDQGTSITDAAKDHVTAVPEATIPSTYTIKSGDTLSEIAEKALKDAGMEVNQASIHATYTAIYEANQNVLTHGPDLIHPNQVITISPEMLKEHAVAAVVGHGHDQLASVSNVLGDAETEREKFREMFSQAGFSEERLAAALASVDQAYQNKVIATEMLLNAGKPVTEAAVNLKVHEVFGYNPATQSYLDTPNVATSQVVAELDNLHQRGHVQDGSYAHMLDGIEQQQADELVKSASAEHLKGPTFSESEKVAAREELLGKAHHLADIARVEVSGLETSKDKVGFLRNIASNMKHRTGGGLEP